jgi:hypothetical protein
MVELPEWFVNACGPYIPDLGRIYWIKAPLLDADDTKPRRPVMVLRIPETTSGTVACAIRSKTNKNGQEHPAHPQHGLSHKGWFVELIIVQCGLWTPENAESCDVVVDDVTFSYVYRDFDL